MLATLCPAPDSRRSSRYRWACSLVFFWLCCLLHLGLTSCWHCCLSYTGYKDSACGMCSWSQADQAMQGPPWQVPEKYQLLPSGAILQMFFGWVFPVPQEISTIGDVLPLLMEQQLGSSSLVHPASLKQVTPPSLPASHSPATKTVLLLHVKTMVPVLPDVACSRQWGAGDRDCSLFLVLLQL